MNPPPQVQDLKVSDLAPLVRGCPKLDVGTDASGPRTIRLRIEIHVTVFSIVPLCRSPAYQIDSCEPKRCTVKFGYVSTKFMSLPWFYFVLLGRLLKTWCEIEEKCGAPNFSVPRFPGPPKAKIERHLSSLKS